MASNRPPKKLDADGLWNYSLRVLGERAYSAYELRTKLLRRAERAPDVAEVMTKLREYGLADDEKFSEMFATSRLANQGFGRSRVMHELRAKKVASAVADKAVTAAFAETDELALAQQYLLKKYRGKDLPSLLREQKHLASAYRRLRMAGFSSNTSLTVLKRFSRAADEIAEIGEPESTEES